MRAVRRNVGDKDTSLYRDRLSEFLVMHKHHSTMGLKSIVRDNYVFNGVRKIMIR